jgi:sec-independent protein translocase protein TatB
MFDFGFAELFVIIAVAVFVIGPKDIPGMLQNMGRMVRRLQYIRFSLTQQFDDFMQEHDLNEVRHLSVDPLQDVNEKKADEILDADPLTPPQIDENGEKK